MKRFLRFAGVFVAVTALVYLLVFGANWTVFRTLYDNRDAMSEGSEWVANTYSLAGLADYIAANPTNASVLAITSNDSVWVAYGADVRRPLGTLQHLYLLLALDRALEDGHVSLEESVDPADVRAFDVPGVESRRLGERLDALGSRPTLSRLVDTMVRTGHWWIGDYLFERLGAANVHSISDSVSAGLVDRFVPFHRLLAGFGSERGFKAERELYASFPKGTPEGLMLALKSASPRVLDWLGWPMENASIRRDMTEYHALYESRMSILSGVSFGRSAYTSQPFWQIVMLTDIPTGLWFHLSANFMNQDFQQRLVYDPALQEKVRLR